MALFARLRHHRITVTTDPSNVDRRVLEVRASPCPESCDLRVYGIGELGISDNRRIVTIGVDTDTEDPTSGGKNRSVPLLAVTVLCNANSLVQPTAVLSGQLGLVVEMPCGNQRRFLLSRAYGESLT